MHGGLLDLFAGQFQVKGQSIQTLVVMEQPRRPGSAPNTWFGRSLSLVSSCLTPDHRRRAVSTVTTEPLLWAAVGSVFIFPVPVRSILHPWTRVT